MRDAVTTGGNALPRDDEPDVTGHGVNDRTVRHLISAGYLSLERSEEAAADRS